MKKWLLLGLLLVIKAVSASADSQPDYQIIMRVPRYDVVTTLNYPEYFAFSPDDSRIVAVNNETSINVWDIETEDIIHTWEFDDIMIATSWSPDGRWIATGSYQNLVIYVLDAEKGALNNPIEEFSGIHSSWSPDSSRFVTDGMRIFESETGELITELGSNWGFAYAAHWSPDGTMIATPSGWEGAYLNIWSVEGERLDTYWAGKSATWSPDSTRIASFGQVREIKTGLPVTIIPELENHITWHPNGEWIASSKDGQILLWDAETGELLTTWDFGDCIISGFTWSNSGNHFALSCVDRLPDYQNDLIIAEVMR